MRPAPDGSFSESLGADARTKAPGFVHPFTRSPVHLFTCSPTSVLDQRGGRDGSRSYTPLAGIPGVGFSARHRANGVSSHPLSYGEWAFTAMAGNRAVSSHPRSTSGCFGTSGRVGLAPAFRWSGRSGCGADSTPGVFIAPPRRLGLGRVWLARIGPRISVAGASAFRGGFPHVVPVGRVQPAASSAAAVPMRKGPARCRTFLAWLLRGLRLGNSLGRT